MKQDEEIDLSVRRYTSRLIVERAFVRGWHVFGFDTNNAIFMLKIPGRDIPIKIFSASPPQMSYPAVKIARDKFISNQILARENIPVPEDELISVSEPLNEQVMTAFLQKHSTLVIKPLDASHGKGITVDIKTKEQLLEAINEAKKYTIRDKILMEQQIEGNDLRILCIDYKFAAAITRIPASVRGDGVHSISELIDLENTQDHRGENYKSRLNYINKERAEHHLGVTKINEVPADGQIVRVIGVANIGMGGERKIITDDIPDFLRDMAVKAAKIIELPVCAVDFMVAIDPQKNHTPGDLKPYLIELNECPQLLISDDPHSEEQSAFIDKYLDLVARYA